MKRKTALVTGGTRGIGIAVCLELARTDYYVYINSRSNNEAAVEALKQVKTVGDGKLIFFDVTEKSSISQALEQFDHEALDLLVNNAGILKDNLIASIEPAEWQAILNTNFYGARQVFNQWAKMLVKSESPVVINMGSISGVRPRAGQGAYAVSKAMIIEWTKQMAQYHRGIQFYTISPGPVATDMIKKAPWYQHPQAFDRIPLKRFAEPEEIGELTAFLASQPAFFENGSNIVIDGGFTQTTRGE